MLREWIAGLTVTLGLTLTIGLTANADPLTEPICEEYNSLTGECVFWLNTTVSGDGGGSEQAIDLTPRVCGYQGREIPCTTALGAWSDYVNSWCRRLPTQPDFGNPIWLGNTTGSIYACTRPGFDGLPDPNATVLRWLPTAPEAPDPEDLARRLLASIEFQSPELGMFPRGDTRQHMGYVGWNMWLWAAPTSTLQWGPVTKTISEGGTTVTLTANIRQMQWNMGTGDTITCGKGQPWTESATRGRNVASPDCGYIYKEDGYYTVTATSIWSVTWSGGGQSGTLPLTLSRDTEVMIGELQSLVVPNR